MKKVLNATLIVVLLLQFAMTATASSNPQEDVMPAMSVQSTDTTLLSLPEVELAEISVVRENHRQNASSETFFLTDSLRNSASNAAMMIGNLPGFKVDWISEDISVGNDKNVPIIVNGREMGFQYAKNINPKRIRLIEIQRYPPGQYSDYPILINIVLFDNYVGWDVTGGVVGRLSFRNRHSNNEKITIDATLSTKNWNTYLSAAYDRRLSYEASSFYRNILDQYIEESTPVNYHHPNESRFTNNVGLSLGGDRTFNGKHQVSLQTWLDDNHFNGLTRYELTNGSQTSNRDRYNSINSVTGLYYRGSLSDRLALRATATYNRYSIKEDREYTFDETCTLNNIQGEKDYLNVSADATYVISSKWQATLGYDFSWRKYKSTENKDFDFQTKEIRNQPEISIAFSPSSNFNIRAGGSLLNINERQLSDSRAYSSLLPRVQMYWRPFRQGRLSAMYVTDILYPNLDQLSTNTWQISQNLFQTGNPDLRSRVLHMADVKFNIADIVTLNYMWRKSKNDFAEWYEITGQDIVTKTTINCDYLHQYIGATLDRNLGGGININYTGNFQWYRRWAGNAIHNGRTWYSDLTATWTIGNTNLTLLSEYLLRHDREPLPQGYRYNQEEMLAAGCNYFFCNGRIAISAILSIPVQAISKQPYTIIDIPGYRSETRGDDRVNTFLAQINVRFKLGKGKVNKTTNSYSIDIEK